MNVLFVFGTRPEAIKLCPVIKHLRSRNSHFEARVCVTGQHRELLDQVLAAFGVAPDYDLNLMLPGQSLFQSTSRILAALEPVLSEVRPELVLVQGDTTTTLCGGLAAFYRGIPVGHLEAGLRTGDPGQPFPEEMNRLLVSRLASLHFAATQNAAANLVREGVDPWRVAVTGNTGIDAVVSIRDGLENGSLTGFRDPRLSEEKMLILVTAHRRESFGEGLAGIFKALEKLAEREDVQIIFPVHPNPQVRSQAERLAARPGVLLVPPLSYVEFVDLMRRAHFLITDSGGVQEEAPVLGKPVLVLREKTERPEAVAAGTVRLVGTDVNAILREAHLLLNDAKTHRLMSRVHSPYGDGRASERISDLILSFFGKKSLARTA